MANNPMLIDRLEYFLVCPLTICNTLLEFSLNSMKSIVCDHRCSEEDEEDNEEEEEKEEKEGHKCSKSDEELTNNDLTEITRRIGVRGMRSNEVSGLMGEVEELLEVKEANLDELEEAFYIFNRSEDGFITPAELWNVMRRLGLHEGQRMEDCERMIRAFDEDGDGKISFSEFRVLLESAS